MEELRFKIQQKYLDAIRCNEKDTETRDLRSVIEKLGHKPTIGRHYVLVLTSPETGYEEAYRVSLSGIIRARDFKNYSFDSLTTEFWGKRVANNPEVCVFDIRYKLYTKLEEK